VKALVITTSYPVCEGSISGAFVRELLVGLSGFGWEFTVVTPASGHGVRAAEPDRIVVREAPHPGDSFRGGLAHRRGIPETLAREPWKWALAPGLVAALASRARIELEAQAPDVVWSHWLLPSGLVGAWLARARGLPHLACAHGADVHALERVVRIPGARRALAAIWDRTRIVAPAPHTARRVSKALGGREVGVCPLPAGPSAARGEDHRRGAHGRPPRILFLGRFEPIKGPDLLLEACWHLGPGRMEEVVLAGTGSLEAGLRARAACLGVPARFPGVLESEQKSLALKRADALVVSSRRMPDGRGEGFPHAAMEALAAGLPVIAPGEGALGEFLARSGAGVLCPRAARDRDRVAALEAALRRFADEPGLVATVARCARSAGAQFRPEAALPRWAAVLASGAS